MRTITDQKRTFQICLQKGETGVQIKSFITDNAADFTLSKKCTLLLPLADWHTCYKRQPATCKSLYRNCYREYTPSQASRCWVYLKSALSDRFHCINSLYYYYYSYSVWKQLTISLLGMYSTSIILLATLAVNRHRRKERQYNMILLSSGSVTVYPLRK